MTYNPHNSFQAGIGSPVSGFGARRGSRLGLGMPPPSSISTISESRQQANVSPAPRTSRSHLLAGLRTAPKSPLYPSTAPPTQLEHPYNVGPNRHASPPTNQYQGGAPKTSVGNNFLGNQNQRYGVNASGQMYSLPEVLAPPEIHFGDDFDEGSDPRHLEQLMATQQYFAQQQMLLQQQLLEITAAQQQMKLNSQQQQQQQYGQANMTQSNGFYNQQAQQAMQPVIAPVPGTSGVYSVFNPMTGQQGYVVDNGAQNQPKSPPHPMSPDHLNNSPPPISPAFRAQVSPPPEDNTPIRVFRSPSPPKRQSPTPPTDVQALPPPSANAFRRSHARGLSSLNSGLASGVTEGPKSSLPKSAGFPMTPMTGTFGPGQARAGEHPIRQPRGPPSMEELVAKPTSNHEGSKNFATRQRRRAVNNLVKAGLERRGASRGSNSIDSPGTGTPSSECEITFSISSDSDNDCASVGSGSQIGAIGSERKKMKSRSESRRSTDTPLTTASASSDEGFNMSAKMGEFKSEEKDNARKNPLLALANSAEERKSSQF